MPSSDRYTRTAIVLHWLIAAIVIAEFAWGWWMQEIPKQPPGFRADAFNLHKSIGLTILVIEHDMRVVKGVSDRVVACDYGQKIAEGSYEEVANDEQVIEAYLGTKAAG